MDFTQQMQDTLDEIGTAFQDHQKRTEKKVNDLKYEIEDLHKAIGRAGAPPPGGVPKTENAEWSKEFHAYLKNGTDNGLSRFEASLSTYSDPDGGYLVIPEYSKTIAELARLKQALRQLATVKTISAGEYILPVSRGGASSGWVTEQGTRSETDSPEVSQLTVNLHELYANPKTTQRLLDTAAFDVGAWLIREIDLSMNDEEGEALITGDGVGKPSGLIQTDRMVANASYEWGKTGYIVSGHASQLNNADKLIELQHALKPVYRQNATWLMNDATASVVRRLKDGEGNYIWAGGLLAGQPDMLLGKPVMYDENMPDIGAGEYPICFGDFKAGYLIIDHKSGLRILRDPYSAKGFVSFFCYRRTGGSIVNFEALKFLKISA